VICVVVNVMRIATCEDEEEIDQPDDGKNQAGAELGRRVGRRAPRT
jgi:hypothetical protein